MDTKLKIAIALVIVFTIAYYLPVIYRTGTYNTFAKCLTERGVSMYGTETCPHCKNQKAMFGDAFKYINYTDCEKNLQACLDKNIIGYPSWTFPDGRLLQGEQSLEILSRVSGCQLIKDEDMNKTIT